MISSTVSAIVPARNEEGSIAQTVESLASQPEIAEIVVVNDQSTDGTAAILAELAMCIPKLKVLEAPELPAGWVGKNHAASLGAAAAPGDWLLFTDADTVHLHGSTRRALEDAAQNGAALVSYSPEQETGTAWERAVIPFIYCRLAEKFSYARVNRAELPDAAANGQYLLVRREAYEAVGGHRAVAENMLEDVALARRVKQAGYSLFFAPGQGIARTRMYRSLRAMWEGWTKNLHPLLGGTPRAIARELFNVVPWLAVALLLGGVFAPRGLLGRVSLILGLLMLAGRHATYAAELRRNRYPARFILYYVPALLLYAAAVISSTWKNTRGTVVWKGREYPAKARREGTE
jgi:glycosyltransferase involved in cell wall biosynthesis